MFSLDLDSSLLDQLGPAKPLMDACTAHSLQHKRDLQLPH